MLEIYYFIWCVWHLAVDPEWCSTLDVTFHLLHVSGRRVPFVWSLTVLRNIMYPEPLVPLSSNAVGALLINSPSESSFRTRIWRARAAGTVMKRLTVLMWWLRKASSFERQSWKASFNRSLPCRWTKLLRGGCNEMSWISCLCDGGMYFLMRVRKAPR